jgi:hypothetical protein
MWFFMQTAKVEKASWKPLLTAVATSLAVRIAIKLFLGRRGVD